MTYREAIVCDLDGTLFDCEHRRHHLTGSNRNFKAFMDGMGDDPVIRTTALTLKAFADQGYAILIVTARDDDHGYREITERRLAEVEHEFNFEIDRMYMRAAKDSRKDSIVKAEILDQILTDGFMPILVMDDRQQVVDMWRSKGIPCHQVAPGDFDDKKSTSKYVRENTGKEMLHVLVGPSGAGKSTYIKENYSPNDVISSDEIRTQLFGSFDGHGVHSPENLALTWSYIHGLIKNRLQHGLFTVVDATNIRRRDRLTVLENMPEGYLARYVVIDRDYDEKMATRGWRPEELVHKHHQAFKSSIKDVLNADGLGNVVVEDLRPKNIRGR